MKATKRVLSIVLIAFILLGALPLAALAEGPYAAPAAGGALPGDVSEAGEAVLPPAADGEGADPPAAEAENAETAAELPAEGTADLDADAYNALNPYGHVAWAEGAARFAWGRANELLDISLPDWGDAAGWLEAAQGAGYATGSAPRANAIAVWTDDGAGHVAYVEAVADGYVHVTEGGWTGEDGGYAGQAGCHAEAIAEGGMMAGATRAQTGAVLAGYIYLQEEPDLQQQDVTPAEVTGLTGAGTEASPYLINDAAELKFMADKVNAGDEAYNRAHYRMTADIDLTTAFGATNNWTPIGITYRNSVGYKTWCPFMGVFDGGGYAVKNIHIDTDGSTSSGLFGSIGNGYPVYGSAEIKNLGLLGGTITGVGGEFGFGGLVGDAEDATITNCYSTVSVYTTSGGYNKAIGGIVGGAQSSTITSCYNTGRVYGTTTGGTDVGGIAGEIYESTITGCYNSGDIGQYANTRYSNWAGGIVGRLDSATVSHSYSTGEVRGGLYAGGIAATSVWQYNTFPNGSGSTVSNCYTTGAVSRRAADYTITGDRGGYGGLVGYGLGMKPGTTDEYRGEIKNSVALNPSLAFDLGGQEIYADKRNARILGYIDKGYALSGNYAYTYMQDDGQFVGWYNKHGEAPIATNAQGANVKPADYLTAAFWQGLGYTAANGWTVTDGKLPVRTAFTAVSAGTVPTYPTPPARMLLGFIDRDIRTECDALPGQEKTLAWADAYENAWSAENFTWTVENIDESCLGTITPNTHGQTRTLTVPEGFTGTAIVTVTDTANNLSVSFEIVGPNGVPATGFTLNETAAQLRIGRTLQLRAVATPAQTQIPAGTTFTWKSSAEGVATVENGTVTARGTGVAKITATAKIKGKTKTATCTITVPAELVSMAFSSGGLNLPLTETGTETGIVWLQPDPAAADLPDDLLFTITPSVPAGDEVIEISDEAGVGGRLVKITPKKAGTAKITAWGTMANGDSLSVLCEVTVYEKPTGLVVSSNLGGALGQNVTTELTARVTPATASQKVYWSSSDETVATVNDQGFVTGVGAGTVHITARSEYGDVSDYCTIEVKAASRQLLSLSRERLVLQDGQTDTMFVSLSDYNAALSFSLKDAKTYEDVTDVDSVITVSQDVDQVKGGKLLTFTPVGGAGQYILRVRNANELLNGPAWAECRLDIVTTDTSKELEYQPYRLDTKKVTVSKKQETNYPLAQVGLWPTIETDYPVSLMKADAIQFKGGSSHPGNTFFKFVAVDEHTVEIRFKDVADIGGKYSGPLEIVPAGGDGTSNVPVQGNLTIAVNNNGPALKATPIAVNTFYGNGLGELAITGGTVKAVETDGDGLTWVTLVGSNPSKYVLVTEGAGKPSDKLSDKLMLKAQVDGWGEQWFKLSVKVTRTYTPPAVKLKSTKMALYMGSHTTDNTLQLVPKKTGDTLMGLGINNVCVDPNSEKATLFEVRTGSFNADTGSFTVRCLKPNAEPNDLKGSLPLLVEVNDTIQRVKVNATVSIVGAGAAVKLKASKTSVTLNPNMEAGETYAIPITTTVAGFDLAAYHADKEMRVRVYVNGDKSKFNVNGLPNAISATLSTRADTLYISAAKGADFDKTYKVELTLPGVNTKKNKPVDATLALTVKTAKKSTSDVVTDKKYYGPKATLSVVGKLDLATGGAAVISAKLTGYNGGITGLPDFAITPPGADASVTWERGDAQYDNNFEFKILSDKSWAVRLKEGGSLLPGTYKIALKKGSISAMDSVSAAAKSLVVIPGKPKVTLSAKKITLYNNDAGSRGVVTVSVPAGSAPVQDVTLKNAKIKGEVNEKFPYAIQKLDDNTYAIMLDQSKSAAVLAGVSKSAPVTLEIWLKGNDADAPTTTAKVTVAVSK